jgi:predicted RNase H-like nuclease (RuvC/YqgF family)
LGSIGSDTTLCGSDVAGINMIAIQALEKRTAEYRDQVSELKNENMALKSELTQMKARMIKLCEKSELTKLR